MEIWSDEYVGVLPPRETLPIVNGFLSTEAMEIPSVVRSTNSIDFPAFIRGVQVWL